MFRGNVYIDFYRQDYEAFINNINQSFLEGEKIKYSPGFGFLQKYSTWSPIDLIDQIKKEIDKDNHVCGIFVDFQKALAIVDHH